MRDPERSATGRRKNSIGRPRAVASRKAVAQRQNPHTREAKTTTRTTTIEISARKPTEDAKMAGHASDVSLNTISVISTATRIPTRPKTDTVPHALEMIQLETPVTMSIPRAILTVMFQFLD